MDKNELYGLPTHLSIKILKNNNLIVKATAWDEILHTSNDKIDQEWGRT